MQVKSLSTNKQKCNNFINQFKMEIEDANVQLDHIKKRADSAEKSFALVKLHLQICSHYLMIINLTLSYLKTRNETLMLEARKALTSAIMNLEEVYTTYIDCPYGDYEKSLEKALHINDFERYELIRQTGFFCDYLANFFGDTSKWKWSFVELKSRIAVVMKNSFDLKKLLNQLDPRAERFKERIAYLELVRIMLLDTANGYRSKYEIVSHDVADFRKAINLIASLKRISILLNKAREADELQKQIDIWQTKLDADQRALARNK